VRRVLLGEVRETRRGRGAVQRRAAQVAHLLVCLQAGDLIPRENTEQAKLCRENFHSERDSIEHSATGDDSLQRKCNKETRY
jgi:hypothetical protein